MRICLCVFLWGLMRDCTNLFSREFGQPPVRTGKGSDRSREVRDSHVAQPAPLQPGLQVHTVLVALTEHAALAPHPPLLGVLQSAVGAGCVCTLLGRSRVVQSRDNYSCRPLHD